MVRQGCIILRTGKLVENRELEADLENFERKYLKTLDFRDSVALFYSFLHCIVKIEGIVLNHKVVILLIYFF